MQADLRSWLGVSAGAALALAAIAIGNIKQLVCLMDAHTGVAGWVQGVGSLLAIGAAIGIAQHQAFVTRRDGLRRAREIQLTASRQVGSLIRIAQRALEVRLMDEEVIPVPEWIDGEDINEARHELDLGVIVKALQQVSLADLDGQLTTSMLAVTALAKSAEANLRTFKDSSIPMLTRSRAKVTLVDLHYRLDERERYATRYIEEITGS